MLQKLPWSNSWQASLCLEWKTSLISPGSLQHGQHLSTKLAHSASFEYKPCGFNTGYIHEPVQEVFWRKMWHWNNYFRVIIVDQAPSFLTTALGILVFLRIRLLIAGSYLPVLGRLPLSHLALPALPHPRNFWMRRSTGSLVVHWGRSFLSVLGCPDCVCFGD